MEEELEDDPFFDENVPGPSKRPKLETCKTNSKSSAFIEAFSNLKTSEFYEAAVASTSASTTTETKSRAVRPSTSTNKNNPILVSPRQRGNPLLKSISQVPWEFEEIVPDYVMGKTTCALFLSLRYHTLNPDYINDRLKQLGKQYELRVLLVQVDVPDPHHVLKNLTRICLLTDMTLMLAWSAEEAGRIIETYKIYESKPPDKIMGKQENTPYLRLVKALTSIRSVNKSDAANLLATFGSLKKILKASPATLALCAGVGPTKAAKLHRVLHQPFLKTTAHGKKKK